MQSTDTLEDILKQNNKDKLNNIFKGMHAMDISLMLNNLDLKILNPVFSMLEKPLASEVIKNFEAPIRQSLLKTFSSKRIALLIELLDSDDIIDILKELDNKRQKEVLDYFQNSSRITELNNILNYKDDSAGRLMATELIKININWQVHGCIQEIRRQGKKVNKVYSIYVVDDYNRLLGTVSLKKIISTEDTATVKDIYDPNTIKIKNFASKDLVADLMRRYDLESLPVVNKKGTLLGRITIDDTVDIITEKAEEIQQIMSGISKDVEHEDTIWRVCTARLPWLIIGVFGGLLGAKFIGFFEMDLIEIPAMAFFIPLITATGGNVGMQSSTLVVQGLANGNEYLNRLFSGFPKIIAISIINALIISLLVFAFSIVFINYSISFIVSISLFFVVVASSLVGTLTPLILHRLNINPALASGPFITTLNDLVGLALYFMIARILLVLFM